MGKINNTTSYPFATPVDDDYVIGTDDSTPDKETKNFKLGDIAGLDPVDTLSQVLTAGNEADAPLIGIGKSSLILKNQGVIELQLNPQVAPGAPGNGDIIMAGDLTTSNIILSGNITDSVGSQGLTGYVLKSLGAGLGTQWLPDGTPNLAATKFWFGNALNQPTETTSITNDESGTGLLKLGLIGGGLTTIDNKLLANVVHPQGDANLMYGQFALNGINSGDFNTALGISSLAIQNSGNDNTAVGYRSQGSTAISSQNVSVGNRTLSAPGVLDNNTAVGYMSLAVTDGEQNTAVGSSSLTTLQTAAFGNTAMGYRAGELLVQGNYNIMLGVEAHRLPQANNNTIAIGTSAMRAQGGDYTIAIGNTAAENNTGAQNIAIGRQSLAAPATDNSIAIGTLAMQGGNNECIAIGYESMNQPTGQRAVALGYTSLQSPGIGDDVIGIGTDAFTGAVAVGSESVGIGFRARMAAPGGFTRSIALGSAATITRDTEFALSPYIRNINMGAGFGALIAAGTIVYNDNVAATAAGLLPGDIYVIGATGVPPPGGSPAPLAMVY